MGGTCPFPYCPPLLEWEATNNITTLHPPPTTHSTGPLSPVTPAQVFAPIRLRWDCTWIRLLPCRRLFFGGNMSNEHARIIEVIFTANSANIDRLFWFKLTCKKLKVLFGMFLWFFYPFLGCQMWAPIQQFAWCLKHFVGSGEAIQNVERLTVLTHHGKL